MRRVPILLLLSIALAGRALAQPASSEPVFAVELEVDGRAAVAGEELPVAIVITVDRGWHINSNAPGDEFSLPTTVSWTLPAGWPEPALRFPDGEPLAFEFSATPIRVWHGRVVVPGTVTVPEQASGSAVLRAVVTAQACNDRQCLPPVPVAVEARLEVAASASDQPSRSGAPLGGSAAPAASGEPSSLAGLPLPLLLVTVFLAGLALNLTPCVYPLIPITVSFFAQQARQRAGGSLGLAFSYVIGMAVTYSVLGVAASLTGRLFGSALQNPFVILVIVAVLLALAASMVGLWELKVPSFVLRAAGGRSGVVGAGLMGLVVGFVAAPCIGPFVLGLLTFVGQRGDPLLGFLLFFTLAIGLGLPYLLLAVFTGAINRMPASGEWMVGVRKMFAVLLVALAVYFARGLVPADVASLAMATVLIGGGLYLLLVERVGHGQPAVDRVMRLLSLGLVVAGVLEVRSSSGGSGQQHLEWQPYDPVRAEAAINAGSPVIIDFFADWCAPCRELDEKTFSDPRVAELLAEFVRYKVDQTSSSDVGDEAAVRYQVIGMPTVIVFRDGREQFRITGFEDAVRFRERLRSGR